MEQLAYGVILVLFIVGDAYPFNTNNFIEKTICVGKRHGTQVPNPLDCRCYYVCDRGMPELRYCTPGLHYDPKFQVCNWPQAAQCESSIDGDGSLDGGFKPPENHTTEAGLISTTTSEMLSNSSTTPTAATTPTIAPTRTPTPAVTTTTTTFTTTNPPSITSTISSTTTTTTQLPTTAQLPTTTKKVPSTPSIAETTVGKSGATNQTGHPVDSMDGYDPSNVRCLHKGLYFLPHPTKCETYFICSNRGLHMHSCASGIHWDYKNEKCNFPDVAACYFNEFTGTTTLPTTSVTKRPKTTLITTTEALPTTISSTLKTPQPELLPDCPSYQSFIPHPHDCRKYYICIGGKPIVTSCPDNMHWSAKELGCGNPAETECNVIPTD